MAVERPWVFPDEVKDYTAFADVKERGTDQLDTDILRAEQMVISYTNNDFSGDEYEEIPKSVKTAIILLAERFAHSAFLTARTTKSETYDDYSYTTNDDEVSLADMGISALLDPYVITKPKGEVFMRLRVL